MIRKLGINNTPFTILDHQIEDTYPNRWFEKGESFEYKGMEVVVINDPIMRGQGVSKRGESCIRPQYTVMLADKDPNAYIGETMDASDVHWLRDGGFITPKPKHGKGYEWIEKERLEKKFGWFDHGLDFEGLKELDEWYENLRTWTDE